MQLADVTIDDGFLKNGDSMSLTCQLSGLESDVTFAWFDSTGTSSSGTDTTNSSVLSVSPTSDETYTCNVVSDADSDDSSNTTASVEVYGKSFESQRILGSFLKANYRYFDQLSRPMTCL